jgi:hypothetical protein
VACKRATSPESVQLVRDEADRLAAIDHPGVVRFVELRETEDGPELVTEYVGPRTLATCGPVTTDRAARLVADLATTVADLHAQGLVHGALHPEHVLVAGERTVLCGLGPAAGTSPADDVNGIGTCLRSLLTADVEEEPIPDRRLRRRVTWYGYRHRALLTLADQATAEEPGRRPAARALAHAVDQAAGNALTADDAEGAAPSRIEAVRDLVALRLRRRPRDRARVLHPTGRVALLGTVGIVLLGFGVLGARGDGPPGSPEPVPTTLAPVDCPSTSGTEADVDGDGCPEAIREGPGWIEVGGSRYRVGQDGDVLELGDWDCDGRDTLALLRPVSGELWRFTAWDPSTAVTAEPAGTFPGATDLVRADGPGCDTLVVVDRDGRRREVLPP